MAKNYTLSIGDLRILASQSTNRREICIDHAMNTFKIENLHGKPDLHFEISGAHHYPSFEGYKKVFITSPLGIWSVYASKDRNQFLISLQNDENLSPYQIITADNTFPNFTIFPGTNDPVWFCYPLEKMAIAAHANINRVGIILHAACIAIDGKGYLFSGTSGAGKSTISNIWKKVPQTFNA